MVEPDAFSAEIILGIVLVSLDIFFIISGEIHLIILGALLTPIEFADIWHCYRDKKSMQKDDETVIYD